MGWNFIDLYNISLKIFFSMLIAILIIKFLLNVAILIIKFLLFLLNVAIRVIHAVTLK